MPRKASPAPAPAPEPAASAPVSAPPVEAAAPAPAPAPAPEPPAKAAKTEKARVIYEHGSHKIDDVIEVPADLKEPWFDTAPAAVAYAESLKPSA